MILKTDWPSFLNELQLNWSQELPVYLSRSGALTLATIADNNHKTSMMASTTIPLTEAEDILKESGRTVRHGRWFSSNNGQEADQDFWIGGVAYQTDEKSPGLWLEAFPYSPSKSDVISRLLDEFSADGTIERSDRDEFVHFSHPTVVVISQNDIQHFLSNHKDQPDLESEEVTKSEEEPDIEPEVYSEEDQES